MARKLFLFIPFILSGISTIGQVNNDNVQEILLTAKNGLTFYLEKIPQGKESLYGFNNRNEFKIAVLGKPYQMSTLNREFFIDSNLSPNKNYLVSSGEYCIPISVNGEYRVLLTVAIMNGEWKTVGLGAVGIAIELNEFEKKYPSTNKSGIILRVYQLVSDFILSKEISSSVLKAYPLLTAKLAFGKTNDNNSYYLFNDLLPLIKQKNMNNK